jgi:hypothetical protein
MKNNILKIVAGIVLLIIVIFIILKSSSEDKPFNQIQFTGNNHIYNEKLPTYYDTILNVAMSEVGLTGYNVVIHELSEEAKKQNDGELLAHVRYDEEFYIFIKDLSRAEAIEVISHEVIHMLQYSSGDLSYSNGKITWMGETMPLNSKDYLDRPWENDAFKRQKQLAKSVEGILYADK